ncbi:conserved protein of unknown function [Trichlorobacter ammonificans]|uniref:Uncharacterized protein n=2 Tax=Trichlorobacter ammonificans TaxID=2916410 RepID=A0ABN8HG06_9BACT|nr:conserved protein of unknown function [Trichlorobacter ammonificans]
MQLHDMSEQCAQCGFSYARIDTEVWGQSSSRRVMCPLCGWSLYEEYRWEGSTQLVTKRTEARGFGAYRLVPPGSYTGYNAFHTEPSPELVAQLQDLLTTRGWKGYLSLWDVRQNKVRLLVGHPLAKFSVDGMNEGAA